MLTKTRPRVVMAPKVLSVSNYKTSKGQAAGYLTGVLHLAPNTLSGHNVCPKATPGCSRACLNTAGRGLFPSTQTSRVKKTLRLFNDREKFLADVEWDIAAIARKAMREGWIPAIRLNATSDLPVLAIEMARKFPAIQFYDYTKILATLHRKDLPDNYCLTFSRAENNDDECLEALRLGFNVAAVFKQRPAEYMGYPVIDGDENDLRFLDPRPCIVGLSAKGRARTDTSGFVIT